MTLVAPAPAPERTTAAPRRGRLWAAPVWAHLAALGAVLLLLVPVVGTGASFLADEGAAIIQARSLAAGHGWVVAHPRPDLDPTGRDYPLVGSERGSKGFAPLAKHPAYALLLAGADRLGGVAAMVVLSLAGTVAAAGLAGALARRLDPVLQRPTIWVVGLASPLLFDGLLVLAHTLGAALATGAVLCAVIAVGDRRIGPALAVAPLLVAAVLLRNEALLLALSVAVVAGVTALGQARRLPGFIVCGGALAAIMVHPLERIWVGHLLGGTGSVVGLPVPTPTGNLVSSHLDGLMLTWLTPGYGGSPVLVLSLLAMVAAVVVGALRARSGSGRGAARAALVAAGAAIVALVAAPGNVVPGLLVAFPLLLAGLACLSRPLFRRLEVAVPTAVAGLFALGVAATQYSSGGTGEWGGRYFALAVPMVVPAVLLALYRRRQALPVVAGRVAAAGLVVCSLALSTMAVTSLRANHEYKYRLVAAFEQAGREASTGTGRPVFVTTWSAAPRFAWSMSDVDWLRADPADLDSVRRRLDAAGVTRFVFVTSDLSVDQGFLDGLDVVWRAPRLDSRGREILVVQETGAVG